MLGITSNIWYCGRDFIVISIVIASGAAHCISNSTKKALFIILPLFNMYYII